MDFELSEELSMLRDMARKFAQKEIGPVSREADRQEKPTPQVHQKAAEIGLVGSWVPEEYGGAGVGMLGLAVIAEELSRVDMGAAMNVIAASFGCEAIHHFGSEEQKRRYLPRVCAGELISAGAFTEPDAGTDAAGYRTKAVDAGEEWVITGNKMFITNATICDFLVVQCVTHPDAPRHQRFSQIIVPADAPGVGRSKIHGKMGIRASDTGEVSFEEVRVPKANLVGEPGRGFHQLMHFFDTTRGMVAAQGLGLAQGALDHAVRYAGERTAFGQPIGGYQLIQEKLTEMAVRIEALRGLVYKACWLMDQGRPDYTLTAMAKFFSGQTAVFCADKAVEVHGGYGYIDEYPVQKLYRDAKILELYEGTKEAEIMTVGRVLLKKGLS
jgi:alkylation response protein AidB-like acyl-CoA dehydrogenase